MFYFVLHDDVAGPSKHDGVARPMASHLGAENNRVTIFSIGLKRKPLPFLLSLLVNHH
jgi:hypothetical protein